MSVCWEYKVLIWTRERHDPPRVLPGPDRTWTDLYEFWPSGETRDAKSLPLHRLLNEIGAEGWELVSESQWERAAVGPVRGYQSVDAPIRQRWIFKRPA